MDAFPSLYSVLLQLKALRRLECRLVVCGDYDGRVLRNVARFLFGTMLTVERSESTQIDVPAVGQGVAHLFHQCLYNRRDGCLLHTGLLCRSRYQFLLCHALLFKSNSYISVNINFIPCFIFELIHGSITRNDSHRSLFIT